MKKLLPGILLFVGLIIFLNVLTTQFLTTETYSNFEKIKPLFPFIFVTYTVTSQVLAPLSGSPAQVISLALVGLVPTLLYSFISNLISAAICFWISRKFGHNVITKLVGKKNMHQINTFVEISGTRLLILSRLIGFSVFELISYTFGLTEISFRKYMIITAVASFITHVVFGILSYRVDFTNPYAITIVVTCFFILSGIFTVIIKREYDQFKKQNKEG